MLLDTIKYRQRMNVMRARRARMFAFAVKGIGETKRKKDEEEYEKYVFEKYRIKVDPSMINERYLRKRVLFRSASANGRM